VLRVHFVSETAQVELRSGRVSAPDSWLHAPGMPPVDVGLYYDGKAVQVVPTKLKLKSPGTKRLKLECDKTAFKFCFQI